VICLLLAILLATFAAFRGPEVASDFLVYQDWYLHRDEETSFLERPGYFEALYFVLNDIFSVAGMQFRIFIGFLAFFAVFIKTNVLLSFARNAWAAGIGVLIYTLTFYLLHEFTQIRAGLAVAFIFLAFQALVHEKRTFFVFWVLVAIGFHSSAIMAFTLLLPYHGSHVRWLDWALLGVTGMVYVLAVLGMGLGVWLVDLLGAFDPRVALYISMAENGNSDAANPFSASAMLLLVLVVCLMEVGNNRQQSSGLDAPEVKVMVLVRRSILIGLSCLALFSPIPELALRLFEINIALLPILAAIVFSQQGWLLQKFLLLLWVCALTAIYIGREEGLVQPYVLFFT
jgi:hypothetical protein